jgi:hypothetical protein
VRATVVLYEQTGRSGSRESTVIAAIALSIMLIGFVLGFGDGQELYNFLFLGQSGWLPDWLQFLLSP